MSIAVHAITKNGVELARKLVEVMPEVHIFVSEQFSPEGCERGFSLPLSSHFDRQFNQFSHHICLFSVGIAARLIAPRLVDKRTDPAVVCVDEQGHHAVAFSGGHRGGANELCERVAFLLEGKAVVTTASDNAQTLSVDMMGAHLGWTLDPAYEKSITPVSAAIVNAEPVLICQQTGEQTWWKHDKALPVNLEQTTELQSLQGCDAKAAVVITDKTNFEFGRSRGQNLPLVVWRPRSLFIGIGCDRNTPQHVIERGMAEFMADNALAFQSIVALVSIDLKADEVGIIEAANKLERPFNTYSPALLENVVGVENPSETVKRCIGVSSVAEAACLHASNRTQLLVAKHKYKFDGFNMTLAVCRRDFPTAPSHLGDTVHSSHKPMKACPNRPIKHFLYHLVVCEGGRCDIPGQTGLAHHLRTLIKQHGYSKGENRIKVSRSHCLGCCRKLVPMVIYQGQSHTQISENHALWMQKVDKLADEQWQQVFQALIENRPLNTLLSSKYLSEQEVIL